MHRCARAQVVGRTLALLACLGGPSAAPSAAAEPSAEPAVVRAFDGVRLGMSWGPDVLDLSAPDANASVGREARAPFAALPASVEAREVLAGLLAWEANRALGDGAHALAVTGTRVSENPFGTREPVLGSATAVTDYRDSLDLALPGPPLHYGEVVVDDVPGLSFERRTLYQATTGRLFVDFRLRYRDPGEGMLALEDEAALAAAVARIRTLSTLVVETEDRLVAVAD